MPFPKPFFWALPAGLFLGACSGGPPDETDPSTGSTTSATDTDTDTGETATTTPSGGCTADAECAAATPLCDVGSGACVALPPGHEIGWKDGSPESVALVLIHEPDELRDPTDLAFNPANPDELWVVNRKDGSAIIIEHPGTAESTWVRMRDPEAEHFMKRPMGIAFGVVLPEWGQTFAVCGDSDNGGNFFTGPTLFSADLKIFAQQTPGGLGSHLDMLHASPFCRGIAHVEKNVYFVFNSLAPALDRYDFVQDHGPGHDDHSDGRIERFVSGEVAGADGVPSHLYYNPADQQLYVADTGNHRIARLDPQSGTPGASFPNLQQEEELAERRLIDGAVIADVVPPGTLEAPSGLELHGDLLYVTDNATGRFHVFDLDGKPIRELDSGLPPGSLAGFTFGPDGKIYFADLLTSRVYRIDPLF
jgi:hypothetical protein